MRSHNARGRRRRTARGERFSLNRLEIGRAFDHRLQCWARFLLVLFLALAGRLIYLQVFRHAYYTRRAEKSHLREAVLTAPRGAILDRDGKALAMSVTEKFVFADPGVYREEITGLKADGKSAFSPSDKQTPEQHRTAAQAGSKALAELLGIAAAWLEQHLQGTGNFLPLKHYVPEELAMKISALRLRWVGLKPEERRVYPYGSLAAQTLGFVGANQHGLAGIEASRDTWLGGKNGKVTLEVDARGRAIPGLRAVRLEPQPGRDLKLTIDTSLQQIAEAELARGIEAASAAGGVALVMDPVNGEILALASQPAFDPNNYKKAPPGRWVNPVVVGAYEPGSTFKLVMACATLEEKAPASQTRVLCTGEKPIGRRAIHCALHAGSRAHGLVDLEKIIEKSCNIGAATLAMRLGKETFGRYVTAMGFGQRTGIELAAESAGQLASPADWSDIQLANIAFGQSISVTPLQLLRAYCAVANGGLLVKPHLIKTGEPRPAKRILSETTAEQMRRLLVQVVERGTGKAGQVAGYLIAGKTGTAQKPLPGVGFKSGKYIGSFIGFVPAEQPRLAILVLIDEPSGSHYGGVVAAPVFREIARQGLLRLDIPPAPKAAALKTTWQAPRRSAAAHP